jgi:hypothetical protein
MTITPNCINELKNRENKDHSSAVAPSKWLSHFQSLGELKESYKARLAQLERESYKARLAHIERRLDDLEKIPCYNDLDNVISQKEITSAMSKLKNKKAPGLDNISNTTIKQSQTVLLPCLSKSFNSCLSHGKYPQSWAEGYISVIHKSGDAADPNNYRGITITSSVGRVFNSILNERLDSFLKLNNIIDDCQIGFTRKARTSEHMFILKCVIDQYCKTKVGRVFACIVDFQKAFDKVIHTGIKLKLLEIGISSRF